MPIFYAFSKGNIIADRNLVSEIQARFSNGEMSSEREHDDFLDYICDENCSCTIHTISYALESNERKIPSPEKIIEQHQAALRLFPKLYPM